MNETLNKVMACDDINAIKNVVAIMAESAEEGMDGKSRLLMLKQIQSEISGCHYDEPLSGLHLSLIGRLCSKEVPMHYWKLNRFQGVTVYDWLVLWCEMERRNGKKIRQWFPRITDEEYCDKLFDECKAFLESGGDPFRDLNP